MTIANGLSVLRIGLAPLLLVLASHGAAHAFTTCLALALLTDIADGKIARWLAQTSPLGDRPNPGAPPAVCVSRAAAPRHRRRARLAARGPLRAAARRGAPRAAYRVDTRARLAARRHRRHARVRLRARVGLGSRPSPPQSSSAVRRGPRGSRPVHPGRARGSAR